MWCRGSFCAALSSTVARSVSSCDACGVTLRQASQQRASWCHQMPSVPSRTLCHSSWKNDCDPPSPPDGALGDLGPVYNFQCHQTPPPMLQGTRALCTAFSGIKRRLCIQHTVHTPCNTPHHSSCEPNFTPLPPKWRCRGPGPCVRLPVAPLWGRVPGHARRLRRYVAQRNRTEYFSPQLAM